MIEYRPLREDEIDRALFARFVRRQVVTDCLRREGGAWVVRSAPFVDDWSEADYAFLVRCLQHTAHTGGLVLGAFADGALVGFASVEGQPYGSAGRYRDLSALHVSQNRRGGGIGRALFAAAKDWARRQGAEKLYISSHSAMETQGFYAAMGCVDAAEPWQKHIEQEPFDRQLECAVE